MRIKLTINKLIFLISLFTIFFLIFPKFIFSINEKDLQYVMPDATYFSIKRGSPPVWNAYKGRNFIGICFIANEIIPDFLYKNEYIPITILVGLRKNGKISGVKFINISKNIKNSAYINNPFFEIKYIGKNINSDFNIKSNKNDELLNYITTLIKKSSKNVYNIYLKKYNQYKKNYKINNYKKKIIKKKEKINSNFYYILLYIINGLFIFIIIFIVIKKALS